MPLLISDNSNYGGGGGNNIDHIWPNNLKIGMGIKININFEFYTK